MKRTNQQIAASEKYWKEATDFVKRNSDSPKDPNWFVITREMPQQLEEWGRYFVWRLGFETQGLVMLRNYKIETFLVPTEWPEWFDSKFAGQSDNRRLQNAS